MQKGASFADLNRHHEDSETPSTSPQLQYVRLAWSMISFVNKSFFSPSFLLFNLHRHMWTGHFTVTLYAKRWWIFSQLSVVSVRKSPPLGPGENPQKSSSEVETKAPKSYQGIPTKINKMFIMVLGTVLGHGPALQTMPTWTINFHKAKQKCQDESRSFCELALLGHGNKTSTVNVNTPHVCMAQGGLLRWNEYKQVQHTGILRVYSIRYTLKNAHHLTGH